MTPSLVGQWLGRYEIRAEIGRGGMAIVYRGHDPELGRDVAIKVLRPELAASSEAVERFRREARAMAALDHRNAVTVYEVGPVEGVPFIAMELLEGETMARLLRRAGPLPPMRVAQIVSDVAAALDAAHRNGFVHRDVKPNNIHIRADGRAKLMDFGLVKAAQAAEITAAGVPVGAPGYMSPEQAAGHHVTKCADIYSLGMVAYEALTGRTAFQGDNPAAVLFAQINRPPPPMRRIRSGIAPAVERVVLRAMAKRPEDRWQSAGEFAKELAAATGGGSGPFLPLWLIGAVVAVVVIMLVLLAGALRTHEPAEPEPPPDAVSTQTGSTVAPIGTDMATTAPSGKPHVTDTVRPHIPTDTPPPTTATATSLSGAIDQVETVAPRSTADVVLLTPRDGDEVAGNVAPVWREVPGAARYDLQVCRAPCDPSQGVWAGNSTRTVWCPGVHGDQPGTYRWRVVALDGSGHIIATSGVRSFLWAGGCGE